MSLVALLVLAASSAAFPQSTGKNTNAPVYLPSTRQYELRSQLNGRLYQITVALPPGYEDTSQSDTTRYPVLYLLDGNVALPLLASMYRYGNAGKIAPLILIGVGWVDERAWFEPPSARTEDYTPTVVPQRDSTKTGGAAIFARVLREEIIPLVERSYKVSSDRGILGNSYGGLFATYLLLDQPDLFDSYVITSPSLWWDNGFMFAHESRFAAQHKRMAKRVYLAAGAEEGDTIKNDARRFADSLRAHTYEGLKLTTELIPGEGHNGVVAALHGLRALYPLLVNCTLKRDVDALYKGDCVRGTEIVAQFKLQPPEAREPTLWRGMAKLSWRREEEPVSVEIRDGGTLRTVTWFDVRDSHADSTTVTFSFDWDKESAPTNTDLAIVRRARAYLSDSRWDRSDIRPDFDQHPNDPIPPRWESVLCTKKSKKRTFFCTLYDASVAETGEYWHGRPAIDAVRAAVGRVTNRELRHPLFDINNDPKTTLATLQRVLQEAEARLLRNITATEHLKQLQRLDSDK